MQVLTDERTVVRDRAVPGSRLGQVIIVRQGLSEFDHSRRSQLLK
jgi:hypothetical protein